MWEFISVFPIVHVLRKWNNAFEQHNFIRYKQTLSRLVCIGLFEFRKLYPLFPPLVATAAVVSLEYSLKLTVVFTKFRLTMVAPGTVRAGGEILFAEQKENVINI